MVDSSAFFFFLSAIFKIFKYAGTHDGVGSHINEKKSIENPASQQTDSEYD